MSIVKIDSFNQYLSFSSGNLIDYPSVVDPFTIELIIVLSIPLNRLLHTGHVYTCISHFNFLLFLTIFIHDYNGFLLHIFYYFLSKPGIIDY